MAEEMRYRRLVNGSQEDWTWGLQAHGDKLKRVVEEDLREIASRSQYPSLLGEALECLEEHFSDPVTKEMPFQFGWSVTPMMEDGYGKKPREDCVHFTLKDAPLGASLRRILGAEVKDRGIPYCLEMPGAWPIVVFAGEATVNKEGTRQVRLASQDGYVTMERKKGHQGKIKKVIHREEAGELSVDGSIMEKAFALMAADHPWLAGALGL